MRVLVLNTGSSSVKYQLIDTSTERRLAGGVIEEVDDHATALAAIGEELSDATVDAVGHRVVHGGERFSQPTLVDDAVVAAVRDLVPLAPLHNPANLLGIEEARRRWSDVAHVAVFDTAFHRTLPPEAYRYAVPESWYAELGVRRYGFHGTSHQYVSRRAAEVLGRPLDQVDLITAHLGNGASMTAVAGGRSVETSMGLTPLDGLVMGTRSGAIDPGVIAHVSRATGRDPLDVVGELNNASGLRGLSGSSDMREILDRCGRGDARAQLAFDVFCHRVRTYVGAYLAVLGRCDAIVFTGGIGENSAPVRAAALQGLGGLGIEVDPARNDGHEQVISVDGARIAVLVVPTDEESEIARQTAEVVRAG
ncbi:MAG TPA: acetate kinase [Acidimicrobiales bacterium]|nr:acetate kinase [Acidimicrobiales bacterium]